MRQTTAVRPTGPAASPPLPADVLGNRDMTRGVLF